MIPGHIKLQLRTYQASKNVFKDMFFVTSLTNSNTAQNNICVLTSQDVHNLVRNADGSGAWVA